MLEPDIYPNSCHIGWHMLVAYPQEFGLPFRFVRRFEDDKQSYESTWFQEKLVVVPRNVQ